MSTPPALELIISQVASWPALLISITAFASNILALMNRIAGDDQYSPGQPPRVQGAPGGAHLSAASDHLPEGLWERRHVFGTLETPMITAVVAFRSATPVHYAIPR